MKFGVEGGEYMSIITYACFAWSLSFPKLPVVRGVASGQLRQTSSKHRLKMNGLLLLLGLPFAGAATLELTGNSNAIRFNGGGSSALLSATCEQAASVKLIRPATMPWGSANLTVWLHNVPLTCATSTLDQP